MTAKYTFQPNSPLLGSWKNEAELASMNAAGVIDVVVTNGADALVFGAVSVMIM